MTAATSKSKKSFFKNRFFSDIAEQKRTLTVYSILSLLGLPLVCLMQILTEYDDDNSFVDTFESLTAVGAVIFCAVLLMGISFARLSFKYLYTKHLADMHYSLPLSDKERFFADYLSGLAMYMIPAVISAVLSALILLIGEKVLDGDIYISEYFKNVVCAAVIVFIGMVMYYTISVFSVICSGSRFESFFSAIAALVMIPLSVFIVYLIIASSAGFGISENNILYSTMFTATNPIGAAVYLVNYIEKVDISQTYAAKSFIRWLMPALVVLAAFIAGSFLLYKKRKAEDVSKPYVFKAFYYLFMSLGVFSLLSVFIIADGAIAAGILICAVIYFIIEVISNRGFKKFWKAVVRFGVSVAAVFCIVGLCKESGGFGMATYVPSKSAVSSVELYIDSNSSIYNNINIIFNDTDVINAAIDAHRDIIDRHLSVDKDETYDADAVVSDSDYIDIIYHKKNGLTTRRSYQTSNEELAMLLKAVYLSDEYAEMLSEGLFDSWISNAYNSYNGTIYTDRFKKYASGKIYVSSPVATFKDSEKELNYDQMNKLISAYEADHKELTAQQLEDANIVGYLNSYDYPIYSSFERTLGYLEELDCQPVTVTARELIDNKVRFNVCGDNIYAVHHYEAVNGSKFVRTYIDNYSKKITNLGCYNLYIGNDYRRLGSDFDAELLDKAIKAARPYVIDSELSGAMEINGTGLFFPKSSENDELVKKLIDEFITHTTEEYSEYRYYDDYEYYD